MIEISNRFLSKISHVVKQKIYHIQQKFYVIRVNVFFGSMKHIHKNALSWRVINKANSKSVKSKVNFFASNAFCIILLCSSYGRVASGGEGENWINKSRLRRNNEPEMWVVRGKKLIYISHHASLKPLFDPAWS